MRDETPVPQREAVWRARSDDPRTWAGWITRDAARPLFVAFNRIAWVIRIFALSMPLVTAAVVIALSLCLEGAIYLVFALWDEFSMRSMSRRVAPLVTLPSPGLPFPCRMETFEKGTKRGEDLGIVTFVEGWLHFEGLRTEFSLRGVDVRKTTARGLHLTDGRVLRLTARESLWVDDRQERNLAWRFVKQSQDWSAGPVPEGVSVLPPRENHPSGVARAWTNLVANVALFAASVPWLVFAATEYGNLSLVLGLPFLWGSLVSARDLARVGRPGVRRVAVRSGLSRRAPLHGDSLALDQGRKSRRPGVGS